MKVVGTIINKNWNLVGLMLKGKPSELGINANKDWMISHFTIEEAKSLIKKSKSCDFSIDNNGNIKSNSTKQLKDLPMYNIDGMPINNDIFIESLIEQDGDIVGAVIVYPLLNEKKKLKLKEVQSLSTYFNTSNFSVRVRDDEPYITGKGDTKREDIPVVKLKPEHTNKDLALYMRISSFDLIGELVNGKNDTYSVYVDGWFCSLQFPKWMEEKVLAFDKFDYYPEKNSKPEDNESGILVCEYGSEKTIDKYKKFSKDNGLNLKVIFEIDATTFDKEDPEYKKMFLDTMKKNIKDYDYFVYSSIYNMVYNRVFDNYIRITKELANTFIKYCDINKIKHEEYFMVYKDGKSLFNMDFIPFGSLKVEKRKSKFIDKLQGKYVFELK